MTRAELYSELHKLVGDSKKVELIFHLFGKLSCEAEHSNLIEKNKSKVPQYDESRVVKVGRQQMKFTLEQKAACREILRELGMI